MADLEPFNLPYQSEVVETDRRLSKPWLNAFMAWMQRVKDGAVNLVSGTAGRILVTGTQTNPIINIDPAYVASAAQGGTGQSSYTLGDTLYASGAAELSKLPGATNSFPLVMTQTGTGVVSAAPAWMTRSALLNVYNVLDYGVKGEGGDDGPAIQAALAAARAVGGKVVFPIPGTFRCSSQWDITGIRIEGAGMGTGSAQQTVIQFFALGTDAAIITRLASTSTYLSTSLSNMRIEANSWDAVTGCRGYGLDIEARITIDNILVYGFYKSDTYFHGGVLGGGPYNSVIKNLYTTNSKEMGILVGTGANNLTFIEPYHAYNGSPSFGVVPTSSGLYDGFHVERDNIGNPGFYTGTITNAVDNGSGLIRITEADHGMDTGQYVVISGVGGTTEADGQWRVTVINANQYDLQGSAFVHAYTSGGTSTHIYQPYVPESLVVIGGNGFANSRYGWNLKQIQNSNVTLGYCEANYGAAGDGKQVYLGNDVIYCTVNIPTIAGGVANVEMQAAYYRYNNTIICQGSLLCSNNENYMLSNLRNYLGYSGDPYGAGITDGAYALYDNDSGSGTYKQLLIRAFGAAKLIFGGTNHVEFDGSNIVMPAFFGVLDANGGVYRNTGSPENSNYAEKGSIYLRSDSAGETYLKTTDISLKTGWKQIVILKSNPTFGDGSASAFVSIDSGDGNNSDVGFLNAGTELWTLRKGTAISGGATGVGGGTLSFLARKNDQSLSDTPLILDRDPSVAVKTTRNVAITTAGKAYQIKEGSNAKAGTATLTAGTVTVSTTAVATGDRIALYRQAINASTALGELTPGTITAATSFVINAYNLAAALETGDASTVYWQIWTPA